MLPSIVWAFFAIVLATVASGHEVDAGLAAWPGTSGVFDAAAVLEPAVIPRPELGAWTEEPTFGTRMRRLTDESEAGGFGTHIYSQLQAFSAEEGYILLFEGEWLQVRTLPDLEPLELPYDEWNAPRWHPTSPGVVVHFDSNDDEVLRVQATEVTRASTETLFTFPDRYRAIRQTPSWEELSHDGRWMAGQAVTSTGGDVLFALDLEAGELGAELPIDELYGGPCEPDPEWGPVEPDWVGVSPAGRFLVVQWVRDGTERCSGLETFDLETGAFTGRVHYGHGHGDLGLFADGTEAFVTVLFESPEDRNLPYLAALPLPGTDTVAEPRHLLTTDWAENHHVSCQGPAGACLVSYGGTFADAWWPLRDELFLIGLDGGVRRLAHHRSSQCGYWVQPRASVSRSGTLAVFASDWSFGTAGDGCGPGSDPLGSGEAYLIDLTGGR